jgi:hypothetical protein
MIKPPEYITIEIGEVRYKYLLATNNTVAGKAQKARFRNLLSAIHRGDYEDQLKELSELTVAEFCRFRGAGVAIVRYAESELKKHNLEFNK